MSELDYMGKLTQSMNVFLGQKCITITNATENNTCLYRNLTTNWLTQNK